MKELGILARLSVPEGFVGLDENDLPRAEAWAAAREGAGISRRRAPVERAETEVCGGDEGKGEEVVEELVPPPRRFAPFRHRPRPNPEQGTARRGTWRQFDVESEHALIRRYQGGDNGAGDILLLAHEPLVLGYARKYMMGVGDVDGLLQSGRMALLSAAEAFEPERGAAFPTYAIWWIRHALIRFIEDEEHTIGLPSSVQQIIRSAKRKGATSAEEVFEMTNEPTVLCAWPLLHGGVAPIDAETNDGRAPRRHSDPPCPDPSPEERLDEERVVAAQRAIIEEAIKQLPGTWALVFRKLHFDDDPPTHETIASWLHVSRARVGQIAKLAHAKVMATARRLWAERMRRESSG